jgi:hypothetical protein
MTGTILIKKISTQNMLEKNWQQVRIFLVQVCFITLSLICTSILYISSASHFSGRCTSVNVNIFSYVLDMVNLTSFSKTIFGPCKDNISQCMCSLCRVMIKSSHTGSLLQNSARLLINIRTDFMQSWLSSHYAI